jgi:Ca2+-binding EF-hand superfamily protein
MPGDITFHNAAQALQPLQPRDIALREVQQAAYSHGKKINNNLIGTFYDFFRAHNTTEIDIELFVLFMLEKLNVPESKARPLFRSFDVNSSGEYCSSK